MNPLQPYDLPSIDLALMMPPSSSYCPCPMGLPKIDRLANLPLELGMIGPIFGLLTQTFLSDLTESLMADSRRGGEEGTIAGLSRQFPRNQYSKAMTKSGRRIQSTKEEIEKRPSVGLPCKEVRIIIKSRFGLAYAYAFSSSSCKPEYHLPFLLLSRGCKSKRGL